MLHTPFVELPDPPGRSSGLRGTIWNRPLDTSVGGEIKSAVYPILIDDEVGSPTIYGHVSVSNAQTVSIKARAEALLIVDGPISYLSPGLYPRKDRDRKSRIDTQLSLGADSGSPFADEEHRRVLHSARIAALTVRNRSGRTTMHPPVSCDRRIRQSRYH